MVRRWRTVTALSTESSVSAGARYGAIGAPVPGSTPSRSAMPVRAPTTLFVTERTSNSVVESVPPKYCSATSRPCRATSRLWKRGIPDASPAARSRAKAFIPTSPGLARTQPLDRSTRTDAVGPVGASRQAATSARAASPSPTRISVAPARWRRRQLAHGQGHRGLPFSVDGDLEAVRARVRERHVEHENRSRLDVGHSCGRLGEVHGAVAAEDLGVLLVHQPDLHLVLADLGALSLEAEHQVQTGVHGGELLHPDVLEDPQHRELARLIDDRIVGDDGEVEVQATWPRTGSRRGSCPIQASARRVFPSARSRS